MMQVEPEVELIRDLAYLDDYLLDFRDLDGFQDQLVIIDDYTVIRTQGRELVSIH
jgi:hypothetical protein